MRYRSFVKYIILSLLFCILLSAVAFSEQSLISPLEEYKNKAAELYKNLDGKAVFNMILSGIPEAFGEFLTSFSLCICVILTGGVFSLLSQSFKGSGSIFEIASSCIVVLLSMFPLNLCLEKAEQCLSSICAYMISFIPTSALLHAFTANTVTASVTVPSTSYAVTILEFLSLSILLPCIKCMCVIMCVNLLCKKVNLTAIFNLIKSFSLWAIGLSFTLFTALISLQSILSAGADNLAMKSIRYGAARLIPIAGSMVSESMRTVVASASFVKSVTGMGGIIFILYTILPTLIILLAAKLFFFLTNCFSTLCSDGLGKFFLCASSILNIMIALLLGCGVAFIIMFAIFIKTTVVL